MAIEKLILESGKVSLRDKSLLQTCVLPRWGQVQLGRITFGAVAEWVNDMQRDGRSAPRVRQAYHLLTGMLHAAVKDGRLPRNPAIGVDLPRLTSKKRRYLRHDQLHALATAAGRYRVLVLTLGYCGLRWGEASALRVHNVDLDRGRLNITDAVAEVNGHVVFGTPKTHQARWLPVSAFLLDELRHTAASLAISAGATVKSGQRMLGHASATLTLDRYGHLFPDELDAVAARRDEAARQAAVYGMCTETDPMLFDEQVSDHEKAV